MKLISSIIIQFVENRNKGFVPNRQLDEISIDGIGIMLFRITDYII